MVKIFIDPGHGGSDPGAQGNGLQEKNLTLQISKRIRDMLLEYENVQVKLSREGDQTLSLKQRTDMANSWGADYLLSIHINASGGTGYEDYRYDKITASSTTGRIQETIHYEIMAAIKAYGVRDRGAKSANFHMVRESNMPALLTENLFIDNVADASLLKQSTFINAIARGHVNGLVKMFNLKIVHTMQVAMKGAVDDLGLEDARLKARPVADRIGVLKVLENTVLRESPTNNSKIIRHLEPGGEYKVSDYQDGWFKVGGWVHSEYVNFLPNVDVKINL